MSDDLPDKEFRSDLLLDDLSKTDRRAVMCRLPTSPWGPDHIFAFVSEGGRRVASEGS